MIYNPTDHTYWNGDQELPSVSAILKMCPVPFFLNKYIASGKKYEGLKMAADLGTDTHIEIGNMLQGGTYIQQPTARGILIGKMVNYAKSIVDTVKVIGFEKPMISEEYKFGGTPDLWAEKDGVLQLHDWKSNQKTKSAFKQLLLKYEAQLGGYAILLGVQGIFIKDGFVHHLPDKNSYAVELNRGIDNFKRLLGVYYEDMVGNVRVRDIVEMWNNGMSTEQISQVVGIERGVIQALLNKYSIF